MKISTVVHSALIGTSCFLSVLLFSTTTKAQTVVDLELALLLDGSGSVGNTGFNFQLDAYRNVFTDPNFFNDLVSSSIPDGGLGRIAVSTFQFGSNVTQEIDWTLIDDQDSATNFGNQFLSITRGGGSTNITDAIDNATNGTPADITSGILTNEFSGNRKVIDISTDGQPNSNAGSTQASIDAIAAGIDAINAIGVGSGIDENFLSNNIVRGDDSFLILASDFTEFEESLRVKITREVTGGNGGNGGNGGTQVPEPANVMGLLTIATFGVNSLLKKNSTRKT